jgi:uncharacterized protein YndB with AHSA1/START domain
MTTKNDPSPAPLTHRLVLTRTFKAPRELVWAAWTTPAHMKEWLGLSEQMTPESITMDVRKGGRFRIQLKAEDGEYFTAAGTYLTVQPPEQLVYTWDWEKDGGGTEFGELEGHGTQMTLEFHAEGSGTRLVLTHENFESAERRDRHEGGWTDWLGWLAKFVEAEEEPV